MNVCRALLLCRAGSVLFTAVPPAAAGSAVLSAFYGVWDRSPATVDFDPARPEYSYLLGLEAGGAWENVQPVSSNQFDWAAMQTELEAAYERNQKVYVSLNVGPDAPDWIYSNGVPRVYTDDTDHNWLYYPYYPDPNYIAYYYNFIHAFAGFFRTQPQHLLDTVAFVQVKTGCTGDECAYKGSPIDSAYDLDVGSPEWERFRIAAFEQFRLAFLEGTNTPIPLLFNNIDPVDEPDAWNWVSTNIVSGFGIKGSAYVRGHHLSDERTFVNQWRPYMVDPPGLALFSRAEMDQTWTKPLYQLNVNLGFYWGAISGLNQGLSIWDITKSALLEAGNNVSVQETFRFFNRYAGQIDPAASTNAFIALHEGLNAADTVKFPVERYGAANKSNVARYVAICNDPVYAARGARMDHPEAATWGQVAQRSTQTNYNDSGWEIWPGNYSRFITQIDPDDTSIGLFRIDGPLQTNSPIYSRFARSFESANGKNAMYFKFHERLFADPAEWTDVSVIYYDAVANSTWQLKYDAGTNGFATALSVTCTGSRNWKTVSTTLTDAVMAGNGPNGADVALINTDGLDDIFHMIKVQRSARSPAPDPSPGPTLFFADFSDSRLNTNEFINGTPVPDPYGGLDNLNAGTTIGSWAAVALEESSVYANGNMNPVLFAGTGGYDLHALLASPGIISNGVSISLDFAVCRTGASESRRNYVTGYDRAGLVVFRLWISGNSLDAGGRTLWIETASSTNLLATAIARKATLGFEDTDLDPLAIRLDGNGIGIMHRNAVVTNEVPVLTPGVTELAWLSFEGDSTFYDNIEAVSFSSAYGRWAGDYRLIGGSNDDDDRDGLGNLYEFGLGGNPTNPADLGHVPTFGINRDESTSWMEYIYARQSAADSGLLYNLELTDNLVSNVWTNAGYTVIGSGPFTTGFDAVTNRIESAVQSRQFIRLIIEER
jgi:hypothetical protein